MKIKINFNKMVHRRLKKLGCFIEHTGYSSVNPEIRIETPCAFSGEIGDYKLQIGAFSYTGLNVRYYCNLKIGRFCSIAQDVTIGLANHPIDRFSTSPFFYENDFLDGANKDIELMSYPNRNPDVEIGDDVWIGEGVKIKGGIKIGDGAVIGCSSVVTKDVPPYAIVGGIPAKLIRYRTVKKKFAHKYKPKHILTYKDFNKYESIRKRIKRFIREIFS